MKLTLAPVVGAWPRASLDAFYAAVTEAPVDTVYLGGVPGRRNDDYGLHDWLDTAARLVDAGKQVVLGAQTLLASNADVRTLRRIARDGPYLVEANDMGSVQMLADHAPFVAGPDLDVYHSNMLDFLVSRGATRWVPSPDMSCASFEAILRASGSRLETEVYAWGRLPLDFPPRCRHARSCGLIVDGEGRRPPTVVARAANPYRLCCLGESLPALRRLGVHRVRVDAQRNGMARVLGSVRATLDGTLSPRAAAIALARTTLACDNPMNGPHDAVAQAGLATHPAVR